jgi:hypothetical protein
MAGSSTAGRAGRGGRGRAARSRAMEWVNAAAKATGLEQLLQARGGGSILDLTMLGSTGTGKTTLLASMYDRFDWVIGSTDLAVVPDRSTSIRLQEYITTLSSLPGEIQVAHGLEGTGQIREYQLGVGRRGKPSLFTLRFTDYPGKYLIDASTTEEEKLQRALGQADVVLVAIDTPALMELDGKYHDTVNTPLIVIDQLKEILKQDMPRLIVLVPLKCERQLSTPDGARRLTETVTDRYTPLLNYISAGDLRTRVGCVLAPAQTLGSVVYSRITEAEGNPVFHFRSLSRDAKYRPVDTDQPLRYALRFIVNSYRLEDRDLFRAIWQKVLGADARLVAAVEQFASGCKTDESFKVLQDHRYLHSGY